MESTSPIRAHGAAPAALLLGALLVGALGGCGAPSTPSSPSSSTEDGLNTDAPDAAVVPSAYDPALDDVDEAAPLGVVELAEGLNALIADLHHLDPLIHHDAYTEVFWGLADEAARCPEIGVHNGQDYWRADCTTPAGARFNGFNLNTRGGGWTDGPLRVRSFDWVTGHSFIVDPAGQYFQSFGDVELRVSDHRDGFVQIDGFVFGDFVWEDAAAAGTWVQRPASHEIYFQFERHPSHRSALLWGGVTQLEGPVLAARFDPILLSDGPGACPREPVGGAVNLRDRAGRWYLLDWSDGDCDGCGEASLDGEPIGEVCADFGPFTGWLDWPWVRG
jgi:hypothetical protein